MKDFTNEQIEYAIGRLVALYEFHGFNQKQLAQASGVPQPTISKIISPNTTADGERAFIPSVEVLNKLFMPMGTNLAKILNESDAAPQEIIGYLATPLTGVVEDEKTAAQLIDVIGRIKKTASATEFAVPPFEIYWPGDHTHPIRNADFSSSQVYRIDRRRASTFDFIILFCGEPSFGVGQENEIATQAGVPAIRIVPQGISRMMSGAFIKAIDISYSGSLRTHINFSQERLTEALKLIRLTYFRHRALYRGINGDGFGPRLKRLIDERVGNCQQFADDLGVNISYLHTLMEESFSVSNPSARLLNRMGVLLQEHVGYLIGESEETDPVWVESNSAWHTWVMDTQGIDGRIALLARDEWRKGYFEEKRSAVRRDCRSTPMTVRGWEKRYRELSQKEGRHAGQARMFTS